MCQSQWKLSGFPVRMHQALNFRQRIRIDYANYKMESRSTIRNWSVGDKIKIAIFKCFREGGIESETSFERKKSAVFIFYFSNFRNAANVNKAKPKTYSSTTTQTASHLWVDFFFRITIYFVRRMTNQMRTMCEISLRRKTLIIERAKTTWFFTSCEWKQNRNAPRMQ